MFGSIRRKRRNKLVPASGAIEARQWLDSKEFSKADRRHDYKNDYKWTDIGNLFWSDKNMEWLKKAIITGVLKKYNVNLINPDFRFLRDAMHETFYDMFDRKLQRKRTTTNALMMMNATREWRYDPSKDEERGIMVNPKRVNIKPQYPLNDTLSDKVSQPLMTLPALLSQLNFQTIEHALSERLAGRHIKDKLWFNKMYNMTVFEKRYPTGFMVRGGGKGLNVRRNKFESMNIRQVPPIMHDDRFKNNLYDCNYRRNRAWESSPIKCKNTDLILRNLNMGINKSSSRYN